eukprot:328412-Rhodomonas_salina.3
MVSVSLDDVDDGPSDVMMGMVCAEAGARTEGLGGLLPLDLPRPGHGRAVPELHDGPFAYWL